MSRDIVSFKAVDQFRYLKEKHLTMPEYHDKFLEMVATMYDLAKIRYYEDFGYKLIPSHFLIGDMIDEENEQIIEIYCEDDYDLMDRLKVLYLAETSLNMPEQVKEALHELDLEFAEPSSNDTYIGVVLGKRKTLYEDKEQLRMFGWENLYDRDGDSKDS